MTARATARNLCRILPAALVVLATLAGCAQRTLVYAERSGFNVSITADPAESLPIEVNAGLKRRVVGLIPASEERDGDQVKGEAVNMFSRFDIAYEKSDTGIFFGTHRVKTAFASGAAATTIAGRDDAPGIVTAIVGPTGFRISDDPEVRKAVAALTDYLVRDADNPAAYIALASSNGLIISDGGTIRARAIKTIDNPVNGQKNVEIARLLGEID